MRVKLLRVSSPLLCMCIISYQSRDEVSLQFCSYTPLAQLPLSTNIRNAREEWLARSVLTFLKETPTSLFRGAKVKIALRSFAKPPSLLLPPLVKDWNDLRIAGG